MWQQMAMTSSRPSLSKYVRHGHPIHQQPAMVKLWNRILLVLCTSIHSMAVVKLVSYFFDTQLTPTNFINAIFLVSVRLHYGMRLCLCVYAMWCYQHFTIWHSKRNTWYKFLCVNDIIKCNKKHCLIPRPVQIEIRADFKMKLLGRK